ncbi:hypothetical protein [Agaribacterium haliotis]|uniref:hypothetical protein n=1 Tax=Agaribacterium haliotis TaxID=2013869 RepID=UPI000BB56FC6|nr:hypothetical protein [Agaribacterium haliotis]
MLKTLLSTNLFLSLLFLTACDFKEENDTSHQGASREELSNLKPWLVTSPWAHQLKECASAQNEKEACTLGTMPLIGMASSQPGIAEISQRLLVSHDWMGERFEELLLNSPIELLTMFRGVTMVVIDDDIRPAYYDPQTGAIYLDPNYLWQNVSEAQTINPKQDFRADFDNELAFRNLFRYVKNQELAYRYSGPESTTPREFEDVRYLASALLLHELAHANDYFPVASHSGLKASDKPWQAARSQLDSWTSSRLLALNPLDSGLMFEAALTMYHGEKASSSLKSQQATDIGAAFAPDGASANYNYSTPYEDVAMLFEEIMMLRLFAIDRDMAFTSAPTPGSNSCADYVIGWGARNRVATAQVLARAEFVLNSMLPESDFSEFINNLGSTKAIPEGINWCDSQRFESSQSTAGQKTQAPGEKFDAGALYWR